MVYQITSPSCETTRPSSKLCAVLLTRAAPWTTQCFPGTTENHWNETTIMISTKLSCYCCTWHLSSLYSHHCFQAITIRVCRKMTKGALRIYHQVGAIRTKQIFQHLKIILQRIQDGSVQLSNVVVNIDLTVSGIPIFCK